MHDRLRRMAGVYVALAVCLFAGGVLQAEDEAAARERLVRFIDGKAEQVSVVQATEKGLLLKFRDVPKAVPVSWNEIHSDDAAALRELFLVRSGADASENAGPFSVEGISIRTIEGRTYRGIPVPGSPDGELWIKIRDRRLVFPNEDVIDRRVVRVSPSEVYTEQELYDLLVRRLAPVSPEDWERFGGELLRSGLNRRATLAFRIADYLRHPHTPDGRIYRSLLLLENGLAEVGRKRWVSRIRESSLVGDYDEALARIDRLISDLRRDNRTDAVTELERIKGEVELRRSIGRSEQILIEWERIFESLLKMKAFDERVGFVQARVYVETSLEADVETRVAARFGIGKGDPTVRNVRDRRPSDRLAKHGYGEATWLVERPERIDPERWWMKADPELRYRYLKGLAIERMCDIRRVTHKNCPACGGRGTLERREVSDQPADQCPDCLFLGRQRVLIYR